MHVSAKQSSLKLLPRYIHSDRNVFHVRVFTRIILLFRNPPTGIYIRVYGVLLVIDTRIYDTLFPFSS